MGAVCQKCGGEAVLFAGRYCCELCPWSVEDLRDLFWLNIYNIQMLVPDDRKGGN